MLDGQFFHIESRVPAHRKEVSALIPFDGKSIRQPVMCVNGIMTVKCEVFN